MQPYFERDGIKIYHGDAREVVPTLGKVALVLTDPPYAMSGAKKEWRVTATVGTGLHLAAKSVLKGGAMFAFSTTSGRGVEYTLGAVGEALPFNRILIWHKSFVRSRVAGPWRWDAVAILAFGRASFGRPELSSVFTSSGPTGTAQNGNNRHPAELPAGIAEWLYQPFAGGAGVVMDPFCGTGVLLTPAVREGRQVVGIDTNERWCEESARRLSNVQLTLESAVA
jgi:tRNA G10  N-methylase Trm11